MTIVSLNAAGQWAVEPAVEQQAAEPAAVAVSVEQPAAARC